MHPFPHAYRVSAAAHPSSHVTLSSAGLSPLESAGPLEFDGPGDRWSPETLLTAALVDCFVLSFQAVAKASRFEWTRLECHVEGTLDRIERVTQFTEFRLKAVLHIPGGSDAERARQLLAKSEQLCLVSNSLKATKHLELEIRHDAV